MRNILRWTVSVAMVWAAAQAADAPADAPADVHRVLLLVEAAPGMNARSAEGSPRDITYTDLTADKVLPALDNALKSALGGFELVEGKSVRTVQQEAKKLGAGSIVQLVVQSRKVNFENRYFHRYVLTGELTILRPGKPDAAGQWQYALQQKQVLSTQGYDRQYVSMYSTTMRTVRLRQRDIKDMAAEVRRALVARLVSAQCGGLVKNAQGESGVQAVVTNQSGQTIQGLTLRVWEKRKPDDYQSEYDQDITVACTEELKPGEKKTIFFSTPGRATAAAYDWNKAHLSELTFGK